MAIHHFQPTVYHTAIGAHEPVLHIGSGDTVFTTTVDNAGYDATDTQVTPGGNPQTGPFYIESAEPGDTLAVHFDRILPNRKVGRTATVVAANVLDPHYVASEMPEGGGRAEWHVDTEKWTATLISPETQLGKLTLPLEPMVGCFGVAPPRGQAISTATSSTHGGNMDYRGFKEGVTVYFPVFVPALSFTSAMDTPCRVMVKLSALGLKSLLMCSLRSKCSRAKALTGPVRKTVIIFSQQAMHDPWIRRYNMRRRNFSGGWMNSAWRNALHIFC